MSAAAGAAWIALAVAVLIPLRPGAAARVSGLTDQGRLAGQGGLAGQSGLNDQGRLAGQSGLAGHRVATEVGRRLGVGGSAGLSTAPIVGASGVSGGIAPGVSGGVAAVACAVCGWLLGGVVLAVPFGLAAVTGWVLIRRAIASRSRRLDAASLLRSVRVISGELTSGAGPPAALGAAADLGGADAATFADAAATAERGGEVSAVLLAGRPAVRTLGHVWRIGESSGAALAVVLDRIAADLSAELDQRRAVAVGLAGPRSSATVVAGLPLLGLALGVSMGADPFTFLGDTPAGRLVCAAGIVLDLAGIAWMARILRRAEST